MLSCAGVCQAAQPFLAVLIRKIFPQRPLVIVAPDLKIQESLQQDIETWLALKCEVRSAKREANEPSTLHSPSSPLFYPAWETLPHEGKLPHADTISDRLQTLVALSENSSRITCHAPLIVTSVSALLQKTFPPGEIQKRTRKLQRGDKMNPLDLIEWLEEQGCEPEAQVTQKGEIALRGGILDVWPLTSLWPVRLEFFGDELESLRHFDPLTQISREGISSITIPPGGELGILKSKVQSPKSKDSELATLLDHLPRETIFLLCEPEQLVTHANDYESQIPEDDPFFISWEDFQTELDAHGMTRLQLGESSIGMDGMLPSHKSGTATRSPSRQDLQFASLDAYRPLAGRAPELQIAEAQRREFFHQLHRWLRQGYAVHVFCNNDGERQRFEEIWQELGLGSGVPDSGKDFRAAQPQTPDARPRTRIGSLARGFLCDEARLVVVTDAEIFGRYKIQRPRRLKSPHALAARSALDIDFTELEEGDLVVHIQYGVGRYLGLKNLPTTTGPSNSKFQTPNSEIECLVIEYAPAHPGDEPPKLYVPVTESHLVGKYVGAGKAHPPLNTLGGTRWRKAREQAERAVRDVAAELLQIQAVRESQPGHAFAADTPWQREFESAFIFEETPDQGRTIQETKTDMEQP